MIKRTLSIRDLYEALSFVTVSDIEFNREEQLKMRKKYLKIYKLMQLRDKTPKKEEIIVRLTK